MAIKYNKFKDKKFKLKKDAEAWAKEQKSKINAVSKIRIEVNYLTKEDKYEAILLRRA